MARTNQEAKLQNPTARAKLKRGRQPHVRTLVPNVAALAYQRWPDDESGTWKVRTRRDGQYCFARLGLADDVQTADGERVLSFEQAQAKALVILDAPRAKRQRLTVWQAVEGYVAHLEAQGQSTVDTLSRARAHIQPTLGAKVVAELTAERLRRWLADLAASPALARTKRGAPQRYKQEAGSAD